MKISFDMQAFQSVNRIGGIGRYNYDFLTTLFHLRPDNQYEFYFNDRYEKENAANLPTLDARHSINVPYLPGNDLNSRNSWIHYLTHRHISSDLYHFLSPFEDQKNAVIHRNGIPCKTVVTLYDFIPFLYREKYLPTEESYQRYMERVGIIKSVDHILAISEATRQDAINLFDIPEEKITNIGIAPSADYYKIDETAVDVFSKVREKFSLAGDFILTVSNLDHRKNLSGLLRAYTSLPTLLLNKYTLVIVSNSSEQLIKNDPEVSRFLNQSEKYSIRMIYFSTNEELCILYNLCSLFVCASFYEGGGLPVVEAMKCGAPVVASNSSSLPEFVGREDNLFDPHDTGSMKNAMEKVLSDNRYKQELQAFGLEFSKTINWNSVVQKAIKAYEEVVNH